LDDDRSAALMLLQKQLSTNCCHYGGGHKNAEHIFYLVSYTWRKRAWPIARPVTRGPQGAKPPLPKFFAPPPEKVVALKTIGHSLKNLGSSQKILRHPWCPKLVTGLPTACAKDFNFRKRMRGPEESCLYRKHAWRASCAHTGSKSWQKTHTAGHLWAYCTCM